MSSDSTGSSRCTRKASLSCYFVLELLGFTLSLVALLSPSWQYVYLEEGRTEHHHGLWLDCKRDYSHDYGRTREYYESLYRLDRQQNPFDQFWLPPLMCVYKFDYYIDPEDLYERNYEENRLQDDANQHLFLGWKIAALVGNGLSVLASGAGLLVCVCAFCHRALVCASTVLCIIATLLAVAGQVVFFMFANYQDNNIIKEDDGVYEQYFGWAFYMALAGLIFHSLATAIGCLATSVSYTKRSSKLVKIEVVDNDSSMLLEEGSTRPFKRSFSAVYRVDSEALRKWERDYMKKVKESHERTSNNFKRTASMPNMKKKALRGSDSTSLRRDNALHRSSSNVLSMGSNDTKSTNTLENRSSPPQLPQQKPLKSALKPSAIGPTYAPPVLQDGGNDATYEYLPYEGSVATQSSQPYTANSSLNLDSFIGVSRQPVKPGGHETRMNVYDKVFDASKNKTTTIDDPYQSYLAPNSLKGGSTLSRSDLPKATLLPTSYPKESTGSADCLNTSQNSSSASQKMRPSTAEPTLRDRVNTVKETFITEENVRRRYDVDRNLQGPRTSQGTTVSFKDIPEEIAPPPPVPPKPTITPSGTLTSPPPKSISLNTFSGETTFAAKANQRSLTNIAFRPSLAEQVNAFDRPDSTDVGSVISSVNTPRSTLIQGPVRRLLGSRLDEVDRSVGSSAQLENDVMDDTLTKKAYLRDAEVRLNLFMKDAQKTYSKKDGGETTV
uniref:Clc-like protein n=1 Tax=Steinernema glaseri TaxID=37863 RepID=A0A1I7YL19_9BILA